jgi:hypothetical protein
MHENQRLNVGNRLEFKENDVKTERNFLRFIFQFFFSQFLQPIAILKVTC